MGLLKFINAACFGVDVLMGIGCLVLGRPVEAATWLLLAGINGTAYIQLERSSRG